MLVLRHSVPSARPSGPPLRSIRLRDTVKSNMSRLDLARALMSGEMKSYSA
ncbi:hypothetical protein D3C81_1107580 [compost metagenome]